MNSIVLFKLFIYLDIVIKIVLVNVNYRGEFLLKLRKMFNIVV